MKHRLLLGVVLTCTLLSLAATAAILRNVDTNPLPMSERCITAEHDDGTVGWFCDGTFIKR